ncbi:acyl-CoA dehydrogenase family protein [Mycolicibacterium sp. 050232]|uniref:acyl-CoA dehydrogenase family protein n=1 Tax=Mycolicibacterium sp. 050232 TaxID=3113982 RepID=UPI002E28C96E|nr:acyl-CoA dehydrogenase family protein [Mycolicibacterium sp. 050232]MED5810855.1 acyl-CoA dehydrogenase family protein [Mycolicibacterium sp. 050232]
MHIGLTTEQTLLRDTVAGLAGTIATADADHIPSGERLEAAWRQIVEFGVPALRAPQMCGLEASGVETALTIEELARRLCAVPALGQAVLATELLQAAGADKELEQVAEGTLRLAPVLTAGLTGFAEIDEPGVAFDAAGASHALFAFHEDDSRHVAYLPLDGSAIGSGLDLTRTMLPISGFDRTLAATAGGPVDAHRWAKVNALALTAVAADLVGVMAGALEDAVRYAGERVQFGVKIGSFQAIQHLLADAAVRVEGARSCLWHAAWAVDHLSPDEALLSARTAKAYASAAGRDVVETAMQVLGGISITWEHLAHLRLRRTLTDRRLFGNEDEHYQAIAQMRLTDAGLR